MGVATLLQFSESLKKKKKILNSPCRVGVSPIRDWTGRFAHELKYRKKHGEGLFQMYLTSMRGCRGLFGGLKLQISEFFKE